MLRRVLLAAAASDQIRDLATATAAARAALSRFVAGETIGDAVAVARRLLAEDLLVTLDYLAPDAADSGHADAAARQYTRLLATLAGEGLTDGGAVEISVKPSAVGLRLDENLATERIRGIAVQAAANGTTITLDAEDHTTADAALRIAARLRPGSPSVGSVLQAALRRTETDVRALTGPGTRVRLIKGAYAEPVSEAFMTRHEVDKAFARCLRVLMGGQGYPMIATHDPRLIAITRSLGLRRPPDSFEYQMPYGVRTAEQRALAASGARVRVSVPYGPDWHGYLVRLLAARTWRRVG